jgi:hypothetical protein
MRAKRVVMGVAVALGGVAVAGGPALGAGAPTKPAGGQISVLLIETSANGTGKILITGAIGDYGTTLNIDKNGKPDPNGPYGETKLSLGTFEVNLTALNAKASKLAANTSFNTTTCSAELTVTAPVTLLDGTGLYKGIGGTVSFTESAGFIAPRYASGSKKGQCNTSSGTQPLAQIGTAAGTGTVSFS